MELGATENNIKHNFYPNLDMTLTSEPNGFTRLVHVRKQVDEIRPVLDSTNEFTTVLNWI